MDVQHLKRVVVIGTSCSGKTTFAKGLARVLNRHHIELDAINWLPRWTTRPHDEFRRLVEEATAQDEWIVDGNYSRVREIVWARATTLIWLNFSFHVVMSHALRRTLTRSINKQVLFSGNQESLRMAFLSSDSIILWVLKTYRRRRREYSRMLREECDKEVVVLTSPQAAERFLAKIKSQMSVTL